MTRALILGIILLSVGFAIVQEAMNYIRRPRLETLRFPSQNSELLIYSSSDEHGLATLFYRPISKDAVPTPITQINYADDFDSESTPPFGDIAWCKSRDALYATNRHHVGEEPQILWFYEIEHDDLFESGKLDPATGVLTESPHLKTILLAKGGRGEKVIDWYDVTTQGSILFSWHAKHWDRLSAKLDRSPSPDQ